MGTHTKKLKRKRETKMGQFSTGLFGCLTDPMTTALTCFVAPFVIAKNAEAIGENGLLWGLTCCCCTNALLRTQIRKKEGIEGRFATDFLLHVFCGCCAITQEARQLKSIEKYLDDDDMKAARAKGE